METTYDVRIWSIEVRRGKKKTSYRVLWRAAGQRFVEPFTTRPLADSFRADLVAAARKGEAFYVSTGLPVSMKRAAEVLMPWYQLACRFVDLKWPDIAATTRRTNAEALTPATIAMLSTKRGMPDPAVLRKALTKWGFNSVRRDDPDCPPELRAALEWVARSTRSVTSLTDPAILRPVIGAVTSQLDGSPLAPSVATRRRKILNAVLEYATGELKLFHANPLPPVRATGTARRVVVREVDRRAVANPVQARTLLNAVPLHTKAYFGVQYYAGLRPEEAAGLNKANLSLPSAEWHAARGRWTFGDDEGWGELFLETAEPYAGKDWTDSGANRDIRPLKQRQIGETRPVPCCPELTILLLDHLRLFGAAPDGKLFVGERNKRELPKRTIFGSWDDARRAVFTEEVYAGPLAGTPYDLRHACVSTWLNGGVPPTTVAAWAGHSVEILFRIYAKCLDGGVAALRAKMQAALGHRPPGKLGNT